jgi:sugar phosphate permease
LVKAVTPRAGVEARRTSVRWTCIALPMFILQIVAQLDKLNISYVMADHPFLQAMGLVGRPALIGGLVTAFATAYGVGYLIWGFIIDRIGPRMAGIISISLWGLTLVWSGLSQNLGEMYASRAALGLVEGALVPLSTAFIARWFPFGERGRAQALSWNGATVGLAVAGIPAALIIAASGWRDMFIAVGLFSMVVGLPLMIWLTRDDPGQHRGASDTERRLIAEGSRQEALPVEVTESPAKLAANSRYWLLVLSYFFNNVFYWAWAAWLPSYMIAARHFSFHTVGWATAAVYSGEVAAVFIMGFWVDRLLRRALLGACGFFLCALGMAAGALTASPALAIAFMAVGLAGQQASSGNVHTLLQSFSGARLMGRASGVLNGVSNIAASFAPAAVGVLIGLNHGSFTTVILFLAVDLVLAGAVTAALIPAGY